MKADQRQPACLPTSLYRGDRLSAALVREAVAWVLAQEDRPPRQVIAVAAQIQSLYFGERRLEPELVQPSFEEQVVQHLDQPRLAVDLHRHLGAGLAHIVSLRARGAELKAIAADQQVAVSTAHQRVTTAVQQLSRVARRHRLGPSTLEPLLAALAL